MPDNTETQTAVAAFDAADKAYKTYEELITSGNVMYALMQNRIEALTPEKAAMEFRMILEKTKELLEDRNAKLKAAKDALRQEVVLSPTQWRGPDGSPTVKEQGDFSATSVTSRSFDADSLFMMLKKHEGKYEELMARTKLNEDGKRIPLIKQEWDIQYKDVLSYLKANALQDVLDGSYDEKEKTPQVKGPKELAFLGEKKDKQ
jgi:hypothetical protein